MVAINTFKELALSFPETVEMPHFEKTSFRVRNKIFATLAEKEMRAMIKLPLLNQSIFCAIHAGMIYPVPGSWGKKGATYFELTKVSKTILKEALQTAYCTTAPAPLARLVTGKL